MQCRRIPLAHLHISTLNYLAHLYLSNNQPLIMVGNFIADHVKGRQIEVFPEEIKAGILLHRRIDAFTDSHPVVEESKTRLRPQFRKYAPVIADIYYDHFLARDWDRYHTQSLDEFAANAYTLMNSHAEIIPPRALHMLGFMEKQNWLKNYGSLEGLHRALNGLSKRTAFESGMEHATAFLEENYAAFESDFNAFFPELINFSKSSS